MKKKDTDTRQWWTNGIGDPYDQITDMLLTAMNVEKVHTQNVEYAAKCDQEALIAESKARAAAKQCGVLPAAHNIKAKEEADEDMRFAQNIAQNAHTTLDSSERSLNLHLDRLIRTAHKQSAKHPRNLAYTARTAYQWAMDKLDQLNADKAKKMGEAYKLPDFALADEVGVRESVIVSAVVEVIQGDEPTISADTIEAVNTDLRSLLIGLCPYDVESARRAASIIQGLHDKYPAIAETLCHTTYEIGRLTQPAAATLNNFANVPCRVADAITRQHFTSGQHALLLEVLADLKVPKADIINAEEIPADAPMSVVVFDRSKLAGVAKAIYGKNIDESRAKVLADLDRMGRVSSFTYMGKDGRLETRERLIFPQVTKDTETGAMKSIRINLDAVFRYLVVKHLHHFDLPLYRKIRREANGDEASALIVAIIAKWDSIVAQTTNGAGKKVDILFADIFDEDITRRNYQNKVQRAIAAAPIVANFIHATLMYATSWTTITAKGRGGATIIGLSFTFAPAPPSVEDTAARVARLEKKVGELASSAPQKRRGRPPKNRQK